MENVRESLGIEPPLEIVDCDQCKKVYYCSTTCQVNAQEKYHKTICTHDSNAYHKAVKEWEATVEKAGDDVGALLTKTVAVLHNQFDAQKPVEATIWVHLEKLCHLVQPPPLEPEDIDMLQAARGIFSRKLANELLTEDFYSTLKSAIQLNSLPLVVHQPLFTAYTDSKNKLDIQTDHEEWLRGTGLFALASYFNHSCVANVAIKLPNFNGRKFTFIATRDIKEGEELTLCYNNNPDPKARRLFLWENYFFLCKCSKCKQDMLHKS